MLNSPKRQQQLRRLNAKLRKIELRIVGKALRLCPDWDELKEMEEIQYQLKDLSLKE